MRAVTLPPNKTLSVPYMFTPNATVWICVRSNQPVDVFMVDAEGLAAFQRNEMFVSWGGSTGRLEHSLSVFLPSRAQWNLLIKNKSTQATVQYAVFPGVEG